MALFWASRGSARAPHGQEFFPPFLANLTWVEIIIGGKRLDDGPARRAPHLDPVPMRSADRFGDDSVNDAELHQVLGGDLHIGGGVDGARRIPPQQRGRGPARSKRVAPTPAHIEPGWRG